MVSNGYVKKNTPRALIPCNNLPYGKIHPRSKNSNTTTTVDQKEYDHYIKACPHTSLCVQTH